MSSYVLGFQDIDKTKIMLVGGKGANLGKSSRLRDWIPVKENYSYRSATSGSTRVARRPGM
jgi:hypothetical protein